MRKFTTNPWYYGSLVWAACLSLGPIEAAKAQLKVYNPIHLPSNQQISDRLTQEDIPTGEGGFAKDYYVWLRDGDQVAIDLTSEDFDAVVKIIAEDGSTLAENDDGPDGSTNSLLFARITESGKYIIRVLSFGETGGGDFSIKVTRLKAI